MTKILVPHRKILLNFCAFNFVTPANVFKRGNCKEVAEFPISMNPVEKPF